MVHFHITAVLVKDAVYYRLYLKKSLYLLKEYVA